MESKSPLPGRAQGRSRKDVSRDSYAGTGKFSVLRLRVVGSLLIGNSVVQPHYDQGNRGRV